VKRNDKRSDENKISRAPIRDVRSGGRSQGARDSGDGSGEPGGAEEIDQVVSMLGEIDIDVETVAEEAALPEAEETEKAVEAEWAAEEPPEKEEAAERAPGETADPVRMYLQEMGGVPLLTRV
jgi:hypothetical protein